MMTMMGFGLIIPLLVIGGIAYALGWRPQSNKTGPTQTSQTPLELLKTAMRAGKSAAKSSIRCAGTWRVELEKPLAQMSSPAG
jgi:hypothetical protein